MLFYLGAVVGELSDISLLYAVDIWVDRPIRFLGRVQEGWGKGASDCQWSGKIGASWFSSFSTLGIRGHPSISKRLFPPTHSDGRPTTQERPGVKEACPRAPLLGWIRMNGGWIFPEAKWSTDTWVKIFINWCLDPVKYLKESSTKSHRFIHEIKSLNSPSWLAQGHTLSCLYSPSLGLVICSRNTVTPTPPHTPVQVNHCVTSALP